MENEAASAGATIQEQAVAADKLQSEMLELKKSSSSEVRRLQDEIAAAKQAADANDAKYKKDSASRALQHRAHTHTHSTQQHSPQHTFTRPAVWPSPETT